MELIERVARALFANDPRWEGKEFDYAGESIRRLFRSDAKAAIRAMLGGVEPVAWHYASKGFQPQEWRVDRREVVPRGWTETPLYSLDALKEALGDE